MTTQFRKYRAKVVRLAATIVATMGLVLAVGLAPASAHPLDNTLPYPSGCGSGAYVITSKAILGGTASMVYSPTCQTNWLEWYGPYRYTWKRMYQPVTTAAEIDTATWSYSRQVYAPGATVARGEIIVWVDNTGLHGSQWWSVRCGTTCEWVLVN